VSRFRSLLRITGQEGNGEPFICSATTAVLIALSPASSAMAQQAISLVPANAPRWEVAAVAGWFGRAQTRSTGGFLDDIWLDAGSVAASAGYRWAPHLKLTGEVGTSSPAWRAASADSLERC